MRVRIEVHLRRGVADPEGSNTLKALNLLGFHEVKDVRSAKLFEINMATDKPEGAREAAQEMCRRLLANPVIHEYRITVEER